MKGASDLPRCEGAEPAVRTEPAAAGGAERILVVEDEAGVRRMAVRMLESAGYRVLEAAGGADAIELLARIPDAVHLLLTDVMMPEMSGPDLAVRVRQLRPGVKVVFSSGHTDSDLLRTRVFNGQALFLSKPYSKGELIQRVRDALDDRAP